jgi:hypothetical protein
VPLTYGPATPIEPDRMCDLCPYVACVKVELADKTVYFCDIHAFVHSDLIWQNAIAIYDAADILPPQPEES